MTREKRSMPLIVWIDCDGTQDCHEVLATPLRNEAIWISFFLNEHLVPKTGASALPGQRELSKLRSELRDVITLARVANRMSPLRVYLAGKGLGAAVALQMFLMEPTAFRGIALFDAHRSAVPLLTPDLDLGLQPALVVTSTDQLPPDFRDAFSLARLLHSAGMQMTTGLDVSQFTSAPPLGRMYNHLWNWICNDHRRADFIGKSDRVT